MQQVRRSILATRDLKAGTILTEKDICIKRPGTGNTSWIIRCTMH